MLEMGPGPVETRTHIHECSQSYIPPFKKTEPLTSQWTRIYYKPILDKQDFEPFNSELAKPRIEQAIANFFKNDYWPIVNAIRQEFGLSPVS